MKNDGLMDFGNALDLMKQGVKVSRLGWNGEDGKGMFLYIVQPYSQYTPQTDAGEHLADAATNTVRCDGFIVMKTSPGMLYRGFLPMRICWPRIGFASCLTKKFRKN